MLQTVDADAKITNAVTSEETTTPACGLSCFSSAAAETVLAADAAMAAETAGEMTVVCGSSCFSSAVADAAVNSVIVDGFAC